MIIETTSSFTRPANTTAYSSGQLVANSTTNTSVVPMAFVIPEAINGVKIWRAKIKFNSATNTNGKFNLHLYTSSPTCTNGDGGTWLTTESGWLGVIAVDCTTATFSDNSSGWGTYLLSSVEVPLTTVPITTGVIYGLLAATAAYTPTSAEVFTVSLDAELLVR
jgi:hypothetical protein